MINWEENEDLDALRAVIAAECNVRFARDHDLGPDEVAKWLVRRRRPAVIAGLTDLVSEVIEQLNDDARVEHVLRAKPELRQREPLMRGASGILGVPLWCLLELDDEKTEACLAAALFIHQLQMEESDATREAMKRVQEFLQPVMEGHLHMTVNEALQELKRQTDETIGGLEPPEEA
jgi:hypothetical protein